MRLLLIVASLAAIAFSRPQDIFGSPAGTSSAAGVPYQVDAKGICAKYQSICGKDWDECYNATPIPDPPGTAVAWPAWDYAAVINKAKTIPTCNPLLCLEVLAVAPCILDAAAASSLGRPGGGGPPTGSVFNAVKIKACSTQICNCYQCLPELVAVLTGTNTLACVA